MNPTEFQICQLVDEISIPETGKRSIVLNDDQKMKSILFAFAAGAGLMEHLAPHTAVIQIVCGKATLTVADKSVTGKPGTWIHMQAGTRHSIIADSDVVMLLTLMK